MVPASSQPSSLLGDSMGMEGEGVGLLWVSAQMDGAEASSNRGLALTFTPDPGAKQANIQIDGQGWAGVEFPGPRPPKDGLGA